MWDPAKENISDLFWGKLKWYVYKLIDPADNKVFYIGKGKGSRVVDHLKMAVNERLLLREGGMSAKLSKIREICDRKDINKNRPLHQIVCHQLETEEEALRIEAILIQQTPGLTNEAAGHNIHDFGSTNLQELVWELDARPMGSIEHNAILLKIDKTYKPGQKDDDVDNKVYKSCQAAWGCSEKTLSRVELALAIYGDVCVGVFEDLDWYPATKEKFPQMSENPIKNLELWGFTGKAAKQEIRDRYLHKKIPTELRWKRGQARSFRYFPKDLPYT